MQLDDLHVFMTGVFASAGSAHFSCAAAPSPPPPHHRVARLPMNSRNNAPSVGNIFSHDNAVVQGKRVAQMATTIHRPDVGYPGTCGCSFTLIGIALLFIFESQVQLL
jgi:hypothetical protein